MRGLQFDSSATGSASAHRTLLAKPTTTSAWPSPPKDSGGAIALLFEDGAAQFLSERYQATLVHHQRPDAPSYFTNSLLDREGVRQLLEVLAARRLLGNAIRVHR